MRITLDEFHALGRIRRFMLGWNECWSSEVAIQQERKNRRKKKLGIPYKHRRLTNKQKRDGVF